MMRFYNTMSLGLLTALLVVSANAQSERSLVREGNRAYKEQKYTDAEVHYRKSLEHNKDLPEGVFNLGDALYKQQRYDEAAQHYQIASTKTTNPRAKAEALHNLGNALLKAQKIPEGIDAYKEALKLNPNDFDTKYNLEYAKALLKQQQQNKNDKQQNKNKQQQNKQDQQDQQKQDKKNQQQQKQTQQNEQKPPQQKEQQTQQRKQQISKEDAERILEALKHEEQNVQKKLHKKVPARIRVEKDW